MLSQAIRREYDRLAKIAMNVPTTSWNLKVIEGTGGKVSVSDLIAYQIGWGKAVIRWYEAGIEGKTPAMPGDGFTTWDYVAIAQHFYQKYHEDSPQNQLLTFQEVVFRILEIVEAEHQSGRLDQIDVWPWCTLPSGKKWPLSKWIQVNTAAPYKRAAQLIISLKRNGNREI